MKFFQRLTLFYYFCLCTSEPECSRFHYEEKTLEKMIKTEIMVEKIKFEAEERNKRVEDSLNKMQEDWKTTTSGLQMIKERHEQLLNGYKLEFEKIKDDAVMPTIAFQARHLKTLSPDYKETLIFTTTNLDKGSGNDNQSGFYTAPVSGIYLFISQFCVDTGNYIHAALVLGETPIMKTFITGVAYHTHCEKLTAITNLRANDQVKIKAYESSSGKDINQNVDLRKTFSGVLLSKVY